MANPWEMDWSQQPATTPNPQTPVQQSDPPAFIPGTPKPISPIENERLQMERERLRIAQDKAAREAAEAEKPPEDTSEQIRQLESALANLENIEKLAKDAMFGQGVGNIAGTERFQRIPVLGQRSANIAGGLEMVVGDLINQVRKQQAEQGVTVGATQLNTEKEAARMAASIANLSQLQDEENFQRGIDNARAFYLSRLEKLTGQPQGQAPRSAGGGEQQENPFAGIIGQDGQPLGPEGGYGMDPETGEWGMYSRTSDDSPATVDPRIAEEAARQDDLRGDMNLIDLAGHGMTLGLTDEASGIGASIAGALKGDFNLAENYAMGRDVEQYRIDQARERYGTLGTIAEVAGGMGLPAGAMATTGRVADAARAGAVAGGVGGFGYGRGTEESLIGAGVGAMGGAALGAGAQRIGNAMVNRGSSQGAMVQRAADDLGIEVIPAVTGGATTRGLTAGARQGFISEAPIAKAVDRMATQGQSARSNIAQSAGQVRANDEAGELVRRGANVYSKRTGEIGGSLYTRADRMAEGIKAPLPKAIQEADNALAEIGESVGGKDSALYKDIAALRNQMADGEFSIPGIRATRTRLREEMTERGLRGSYSDRLYGKILDAAEQDMIAALEAAGKGNAASAMRTASAFWKKRVETIDEVLEPLLGKSAPRSGEQILSALERMSHSESGNAANLRRLMQAMPKEEAASVRATVINRLGRPTAGAADARDAFSFNTFLTNWNNMSMPAKRTMFPGETIEALEKLATVSRGVKRAGADMNTSNTARAITAQAAISGGFWLLEPMAAISLGGGQYAVGKLLASPRFARMLSGAPRNATAAGQRAWARSLGQIAKAEPALAKEIKLFQDAVVRSANDNAAVSTVAAQDDQQGN